MRILILCILIQLTVQINAQRQTMLVKFNGDTLYFDNVSAGGKTMVCKKKGEEKVKIPASEVSFYVEPYKIWVQKEGEKAKEQDTTRKCFVPEDGKIHTVLIENDKYYLTEITKEIDGMEFHDYYIHDKKNVEQLEIKEDKTALDALTKYFGGECPEFDMWIVKYKPKFDKKIFPIQEWYDLMYQYNQHCKK